MSNRTTLPNHPLGDDGSTWLPAAPVVRNSGLTAYRYWDLSKLPAPSPFPTEVPVWARDWASARSFYVIDDFGSPLVLTSHVMVSLIHGRIDALQAMCAEPLPLEASCLITLGPTPEARLLTGNSMTPVAARRSSASLSEMLLWLLCFPSAKRSWANVYLNSLRGLHAMPLPEAAVHVHLTSGMLFGVRIATRLWLDAVIPTEAPLPAYEALNGRIFQIRRPPERAPAGQAALLRRADGSTDCSDEEWASVRRVVTPTKTSYAKARDGRQIFDLLLYRLCHGLPFSMLPTSINNASRVYVLELSLRKADVLDSMVARLVQSRTLSE